MRLRVELIPLADISEHHVRVDEGVQVVDALVVTLDDVLEGCNVLGSAVTVAAAIVSRSAAITIAVDVHVDKLTAWAFQVDDIVVILVVAAVIVVCNSVLGHAQALDRRSWFLLPDPPSVL